MWINEVSKLTGLTKKAIEYYVSQGLVNPAILSNGYREYSEHDIALLNQIFVLRKLSISIDNIKLILEDSSNSALRTVSIKKELDLRHDEMKKVILEKLCTGESYEVINKELSVVDRSKTVTERLLEAFPGYYGQFICLHFARFLEEPILTKTQQQAYETIISFLDDIPSFDMPKDLERSIFEDTKDLDISKKKKLLEDTKQSIENPEEFILEHKEVLEQYLAYKQSKEYEHSSACKLMEFVKKFNQTSGYYDVFIPAMKQLSSSYAEYYRHLEIANEKLLIQYPEIEKWNKQVEDTITYKDKF